MFKTIGEQLVGMRLKHHLYCISIVLRSRALQSYEKPLRTASISGEKHIQTYERAPVTDRQVGKQTDSVTASVCLCLCLSEPLWGFVHSIQENAGVRSWGSGAGKP